MRLRRFSKIVGTSSAFVFALFFLSPEAALPEQNTQSPYRDDVPPVIKPPSPAPPRDDSPTWATFREVLSAYGNPRVAIFWNWELTDDAATPYRDVEKKSSGSALDTYESESKTGFGVEETRHLETGEKTKDTSVKESFTEAGKPGKRKGPDEKEAWILESTYLNRLAAEGVFLVDRALATRLAADRVSNDRPNVQAIEMRGLEDHADLLVEVLATPDSRGEIGQLFRISIREVRTGRMLGSFLSQALVPRGATRRWVAGNNGFELATPPAPTLDEVADQLALDTAKGMIPALATATPTR